MTAYTVWSEKCVELEERTEEVEYKRSELPSSVGDVEVEEVRKAFDTCILY